MSDVFFYGMLRHAPLRDAVLGRCGDPLDLVPASLPGYAAHEVVGQHFPQLQDRPGARTPGVLARGLSKGALARLRFFGLGLGYDLRRVSVELASGQAVSAMVFMPLTDTWPVGAPWTLERWVETWGPIAVRATGEAMDHFGKLSAEDVARRYPGIRIRAAAWVAAQARGGDAGGNPGRDLTRDVVVHAHHRCYSNFFAAEEMDLQYRRYDGTLSPVLNRGAQVLGQAVVVLPYDPVRDAVLLVEQFRTPVFMGGDPAPWVWEPVSGLIDPGEAPQEAAHRETMEEAGLHLSRLETVAGLYSSTGANSEFVHLFIGLGDLGARLKIGGLAQEGEDIRTGVVSYGDLMQRVDRGQYRDMPLVTCALWLARHRDRLREAA